jgi:hypothetical protein
VFSIGQFLECGKCPKSMMKNALVGIVIRFLRKIFRNSYKRFYIRKIKIKNNFNFIINFKLKIKIKIKIKF